MNPEPFETYPTARAAALGETLTLTEWDPRLKPTALLPSDESREARYADLRLVGDAGQKEVIASHDHPGGIDEVMREALLRWAADVGVIRIWLPDELLEVRAAPPPCRVASTTCPTCKLVHRAQGMRFWEGVRSTGLFPTRCASCGGHLFQWKPEGVS